MIEIFSFNIDLYKNILILLFALTIFIKAGGVSFFIRILLKLLKYEYNNPQLKDLDKDDNDLQRFRILDGVNVNNVTDAIIIHTEIKKGTIKKSQCFLSGLIGPVGLKKSDSTHSILAFIIVSTLFVFALTIGIISENYKMGYTTFYSDDEQAFMSEHKIINKKTGEKITLYQCGNLDEQKNASRMNVSACAFLKNILINDKEELIESIQQSRTAQITRIIFCLIATISGFIIWISYFNYRSLNTKIFALKDNLKKAKDESLNDSVTQ
ncbi:hypothetical protein ACL2XG_05160 [Sodalis sp. RH24]|uniref:hypothetical protein n=1 Tax=unclassified Sodalis (in: enterobacteria) TaxID=2636512 RepID=UPI0039B69191